MATKKTAENAGKEIEKVVKKAEEVVEAKPAAKEVKAEEPAKKTAAKKTAAKKTAAKKFEPKKTTVVFEANGKSYDYDEVVKAVTKACKGQTAKKLEIYVNANEGAAYYVLDGTTAPEFKVEL